MRDPRGAAAAPGRASEPPTPPRRGPRVDPDFGRDRGPRRGRRGSPEPDDQQQDERDVAREDRPSLREGRPTERHYVEEPEETGEHDRARGDRRDLPLGSVTLEGH